MKFKAYHKIKQFKDIVRDIRYSANFVGLDDSDQPVYEDKTKPIVTFKGTVKLHGTNAGICYTPKKGIVAQKRSSLLDPTHLAGTHFGFNQFVQITRKDDLLELMEDLWQRECNEDEQVTLYGEWAGEGVQKGVGISQGKKGFFIFDCQIYNLKTEEEKWVDISQDNIEVEDVYNIHDFITFSIDIDFNNPGLSQNDLVSYTNDVEELCPVAGALERVGIGEGIVWTAFYKGNKHIFKVKGEKHSTSKVKKLASVDPEKLKSIQEFIDYACTVNRIEQGIQEINATEKKHTPDLLRWIANDIITEESDTLEANSLDWKDVAKDISHKARIHFLKN